MDLTEFKERNKLINDTYIILRDNLNTMSENLYREALDNGVLSVVSYGTGGIKKTCALCDCYDRHTYMIVEDRTFLCDTCGNKYASETEKEINELKYGGFEDPLKKKYGITQENYFERLEEVENALRKKGYLV